MRTLPQSNAMQSRILLFVSKITSRAVLDMQKMRCVLSRSATSKVSSENKESIINKVQQHKFGLKLTEQLFTPSNISMHILHTVLYMLPKVLTRRICLIIKRKKELLQLVIISFILITLMFDSGVIL